jgi:exodeoxyribonuclease VII small subunit
MTARSKDAMTDGKVTAAQPTYEQARAELATVVERLEAGGTSLEESLSLWERGEELADVCQRWLDGARSRLAEARDRRAASEQAEA